MPKNLNISKIIPTPTPQEFNAAKGPWPIAVGSVFPSTPTATPASNIINKYLNGTPGATPPTQKKPLLISPVGALGDFPSFIPKYIKPGLPNNMLQVGGVALNNTPLLSNLEISAFTYTDNNGNTKGFEDMIFNTVLIICDQNKKIVETGIQGSDDGDVFEYSGMGNYDVTINIIISSGSNGVYPQTDVEELIKALVTPYPLTVHSWYLQMLDINQITIMGYTNGMTEGSISQQAITIKAKSNKNTVLIIQ